MAAGGFQRSACNARLANAARLAARDGMSFQPYHGSRIMVQVGGWASRAAWAAADARNGEEVSGGSGGGGGRAVTGGEDGGTGAAADCLDWLVAALS